MYNNGFTGQKFLSVIVVTNAPLGYQAYTCEEFAAASEHITLETPHNETHWRAVRVTNVGNYGDCGIFTGV